MSQKGKWFGDLDGCVECGTTERNHHGQGLCINCYMRKRRKDNLERMRAYGREYESRSEVKERRKIKSQNEHGRERSRRGAAKYRSTHNEVCLERTRIWRDSNRDKIKTYNDSRKDYKIVQRYGQDALRKLIECDHACQKCGSTNKVAIHHIDWNPENNTYENFMVLCGVCHGKVHRWIPKRLRKEIFDEWMRLPLEETDGELRVRNIRFPEKNEKPQSDGTSTVNLI